MSKVNQDIIEFGFSKKATAQYDINILVGTTSLYYMVSDAQHQVLALRSYHYDTRRDFSLRNGIQEIFFEDELLHAPFRSAKVAFSSRHFTLVPNDFFNANCLPNYLNAIAHLNNEEIVDYDDIKDMDFKNVYSLEEAFTTIIDGALPNITTFHSLSVLIQGFRVVAGVLSGKQIFMNVRDNQIQILFFEAKSLIFVNSYYFKTSEDVIYYLLMVYEQFELDPQQIPLSIAGFLTMDSEIYRLIYRYIGHISFIGAPAYLRFGNQFAGVLPHFYFDLFSLYLCQK